MHETRCPACGGPSDILHTQVECKRLQTATQDTEVDRYYLSIISGIIGRSHSPMVAAYQLYIRGFLKVPETNA